MRRMIEYAPRLVVATLCFACSSSSSQSEPTPKKQSCEQRMDRFAAQLAPVATEPGNLLAVPARVHLVESDKGSPVREPGVTIAVDRDGMTVDGELVERVEPDLRERLARQGEMMEALGEALSIYIAADASTPAPRVAEIAASAPEGVDVRFVLLGPARGGAAYEQELLAVPAVQQLHRDMDSVDPSRRAMQLAQSVEQAIGTCTPLIRVFGQIAALAPADKGAFLAREAPAALRQCKCNVGDLDLLEYAMLAVMGAFDRPLRWIPVADAAAVLGP